MLLAQDYDQIDENGSAFCSAHRRRLIEPDLRSRVYGYLATAPVATPGLRTDGEWAWTETAARMAGGSGCAPQEQLLAHLAERDYLRPDAVPASALAEAVAAARRPATPDPPPAHAVYYLGVAGQNLHLRRVTHRTDGDTIEDGFARGGWEPGEFVSSGSLEFVEISELTAATVLTKLGQERYEDRLAAARESDPLPGRMAWARLYDGESPEGSPWFSPRRLRLPERERRERLAAYLEGGRLVLRGSGHMSDPLDPGRGPVVPLSYRTDGTWLWPEALAYYVRSRGVAPELGFLCHLESRGLVPPAEVPDEAARAATEALEAGPPPRATGPSYVYYYDGEGGVVRAAGDDAFDADALGPDLRWTDTDLLAAQRYRGSDHGLIAITEAEAVRVIDRQWARHNG